jgi:hypothetical protein
LFVCGGSVDYLVDAVFIDATLADAHVANTRCEIRGSHSAFNRIGALLSRACERAAV